MRQSFSEYSTLEIASYVVQYAFDCSRPISNLSLQKILYFLQYASLVKFDKTINRDIEFEAWRYGPVVTEVYYHYRINGGCPVIPRKSGFNETKHNEIKRSFEIFNQHMKDWLSFNTWSLVDISHKPGTAWAEYYKEGENNIIPVDLIKQSDLKQELKLL